VYQVVDVAVCWNYLVVADTQHVTKYGLVNNKPGLGKALKGVSNGKERGWWGWG
jgi:hypothetical protein